MVTDIPVEFREAAAKGGGPDDESSSLIDGELARSGTHLRFSDQRLEEKYRSEQHAQSRPYNRTAVLLLILIFDLCPLSIMWAVPDVIGLTLVLRIGVATPLMVALAMLEWRGVLGRWTGAGAAFVPVMASVVCAVEIRYIPVASSVAYAYAATLCVPALQCLHLSPRQVSWAAVGSAAVYIAALAAWSEVPAAQMPLLIMDDLAMAGLTLLMSVRMDLRDRRAFLLSGQAEMGRATLARQNVRLAQLSRVDALTGLANRRCFDEALAALFLAGERRRREISLVIFDVDHFKKYNDSMGHVAGDDCLRMVAQIAASCVREGVDTLARYGGEEFAIILPDMALDVAITVAERVRQTIADQALPHPGLGGKAWVSVSLGVAATVAHGGHPAALIEAADRCLYAAKRSGRNRVLAQEPCGPMAEGLELATPRFGGDAGRTPEPLRLS